MTALSETSTGASWLGRFGASEIEIAAELIDQVLLVSRNDFVAGLRELLDELAGQPGDHKQQMALYAERPVKTVFDAIPAYFPNSRHGRAAGAGVPPIIVDPRDQEVGSEGIVAQFITDYCRRNRTIALAHPGPTKMRQAKVREIVIVTDFIGSGNRLIKMLDAFRYVATLRSWRSYGLIHFVVVAYSGTISGITAVRLHKLRPEVRVRMGCPTIANTFHGAQRTQIESLCKAYPIKHSDPLGYEESAALIAFAHGCPNNVPPILHSRASGWIPLFAGRSTSNASDAFPPEGDALVLDQRAKRLLGIREARLTLMSLDQKRWISTMLILSAAEVGLRTTADISSRTHLTFAQVTSLVALANDALWLNETGRLTRLGRNELARLRKRRKQTPALPSGTNNNYYYPTQLRTP
jgi:hypothetical protein